MVDPETPTSFNPGIARTVTWLIEQGFTVMDAGDETHVCDCGRDYPFVILSIMTHQLLTETDRLVNLLRKKGVRLHPLNDEKLPCVQGSYDPGDECALIDLQFVDDKLLFPVPQQLKN